MAVGAARGDETVEEIEEVVLEAGSEFHRAHGPGDPHLEDLDEAGPDPGRVHHARDLAPQVVHIAAACRARLEVALEDYESLLSRLGSALRKLSVANVAELVKFALEHGLTPPSWAGPVSEMVVMWEAAELVNQGQFILFPKGEPEGRQMWQTFSEGIEGVDDRGFAHSRW